MIDGGTPYIPKSLWRYFVKEIAGLDRIQTIEDLRMYVDVNLESLSH